MNKKHERKNYGRKRKSRSKCQNREEDGKPLGEFFEKEKKRENLLEGKTLKSFSSSESFSSFEFAVWKFQFALSHVAKSFSDFHFEF